MWQAQADELWAAYAEGFNAGKWGESRQSNPYAPADQELYRAWRRGWNDGNRENA